MTKLRAKSLSAQALFGAAAIWFVSVTLCTTRADSAETHHTSPEEGRHAEHSPHEKSPSNHAHPTSTDDGQSLPTDGDSCGCGSFKSCPAKIAHNARLAVPATSILIVVVSINEVIPLTPTAAICVPNNGPPGIESFVEQFLQQCLLSQAPPTLA